MTTKRKFILKLFIGGLFACWMFFSTSIITSIVNRDVKIQQLSEIPMNNQVSVYYWIDDSTVSDNLMNTVSIYGWLVGAPETYMTNKKVSIVLASDQYIYEIEGAVFPETNVLNMLKDRGLEIINDNVRFGASFSPLTLKNGVYQMYLLCKDGENSVGVAATNSFFKQEASGFRKYDKVSDNVKRPKLLNENKAMGYGWVDEIKKDGKYININGWGFLDKMDSYYQQAFIAIKGGDDEESFYLASPYERFDLVGLNDNIKNQHSGISAKIYIGDSPIKNEDITIYVTNGNKWFAFKPSGVVQNLNEKQ